MNVVAKSANNAEQFTWPLGLPLASAVCWLPADILPSPEPAGPTAFLLHPAPDHKRFSRR